MVETGDGQVRFHKPMVYQERSTADGRRPKAEERSAVPAVVSSNRQSSIVNRQYLDGRYVISGESRVSFEVASYNPAKPLVIDPVMVYSTYLGGSGYNAPDAGYGVAVDANGKTYVAGSTGSSDFPVTAAAYQNKLAGRTNAFVAKFDPTQSGTASLIYSTYLGGEASDSGAGIAVDAAGNVYVAGTTNSAKFPTTTGAFRTVCGTPANCNGQKDAFASKLNSTGSSLLYSTYLGGSNDDYGSAIAVDSSGNIYVTGNTLSSNFPHTPSAYQTSCGTDGNCNNGNYPDAFVTKLHPAGAGQADLVYSTYLGGENNDYGNGIAVDLKGHIYVAGQTQSSLFPVTSNAFQVTINGGSNAFVSEIDPTRSGVASLLYSTYLGGNYDDMATALALDSAGNAYVTGNTNSQDFPTTPGAFDRKCVSTYEGNPCDNGRDAFVAKLNSMGSDLVYSTYLGGSSNSYGNAIAVDKAGGAYVTGYTESGNFPVTPNALQSGCASCSNGNYNAFVTRLTLDGSALVYSSFLGGSDQDYGYAIAADSRGNAYVTGRTESTDFPMANPPNGYQDANNNPGGGNGNAFLSVILTGPAAGSPLSPIVSLTPTSLNFGQSPVGTSSPAQSVTLTNTGSVALNISSISASGDFSQTNNCSGSLASGTSCVISVVFTPTAEGLRRGAIAIADNAAGSPQQVPLTGTGEVLVFVPDPSSLNFGRQRIKTTSPPQVVTLTNVGNAILKIGGMSSNNADFAATSNCRASIAPKSSCTMSVRFTPYHMGGSAGTINVYGGGSPRMVVVVGTGTP